MDKNLNLYNFYFDYSIEFYLKSFINLLKLYSNINILNDFKFDSFIF